MQRQTVELKDGAGVNNHTVPIPIELRYPLEAILDLLKKEREPIAKHNLSMRCISTLNYCSDNGYSTSEYWSRLTKLLS